MTGRTGEVRGGGPQGADQAEDAPTSRAGAGVDAGDCLHADADRDGPRRGATWSARFDLVRVLGAVAVVPIVVAGVRAVAQGWVPVGDSALIAIRAQDVLGGGQLPLLGMWASTSWTVGFDVNHPGPLLFDVLALPVALFGNAAGGVVGAVTIEVASVAGIVLVARRRAGWAAGAWAAAVSALLAWSLGSAVLVEPWHASTILLPFLLLAVLAWAVADGDAACLPWAVLVGSLVLHTNLGYAVLTLGTLVWAVVALALDRRRRRSWAPVQRPVVVALVVGALCWVQPLVEQLTGDGEGNMTGLVRTLGEDVQTLNWSDALRALAEVLALPPWWLRPSYVDAFAFGPFGNPLPSLLSSVAGLAILGAVVIGALRAARRRGDRTAVMAVGTALVMLAAAILSANESPTASSGTVAYQLRWMWPVAAFVVLAVVVAMVRGTDATRARRVLVLGAGCLTVVASVANLPATDYGTTAPASTLPVARAVTDELDGLDVPEPVLVRCAENIYDPYCEAVMAELARQEVAFVVEGGVGVRQLGTGRRGDGTAAATMTVVAGELAAFAPPGARQLALHEPLDQEAVDELETRRADVAAALTAGELRLDGRGRRAAETGRFESVDPDEPASIDGTAAVALRRTLSGDHRRDIAIMVEEDLLDVGDRWAARLDRLVELQRRADDETVAVYLDPALPSPDAG